MDFHIRTLFLPVFLTFDKKKLPHPLPPCALPDPGCPISSTFIAYRFPLSELDPRPRLSPSPFHDLSPDFPSSSLCVVC